MNWKIFKDIKTNDIIFFLFSIIISYLISSLYLPAEDASILYNYSENLSNTGVISYFPGGEITEGATDFLWMIALSFFYTLGLDTFFAAVFLNLISLYIAINLIKKHYNLSQTEYFFVLIFHIFLAHTYSSILGFSTLFVELFYVLVIINFLKNNVLNTLIFSFIGCLIRPDFILLISLFNIILFKNNFSKKTVYLYCLFIVLGVIYFFLRASYFQELFPVSFYLKVSWNLFNNVEWARQLLILSPSIALFGVINFKKSIKEKMIVLIISLILPTLYYTNQTLMQNIGYRFYFYIPVLFIFILYESKFLINKIFRKKIIYSLFVSIMCLSVLFQSFERFVFFKGNFISSKSKYAVFLNDLYEINKSNNILIGTTESGHIPYYSKAETVDFFGLNTKMFMRKPADGSFLQNNIFDILVINRGKNIRSDFGCNDLEILLKKSKNITNTTADRSDSWSNFGLKLLSGIDLSLYQTFHHTFPTSIFVNKNSNSYIDLEKSLLNLGASKCTNIKN
jgi:hypothetical protein